MLVLGLSSLRVAGSGGAVILGLEGGHNIVLEAFELVESIK